MLQSSRRLSRFLMLCFAVFVFCVRARVSHCDARRAGVSLLPDNLTECEEMAVPMCSYLKGHQQHVEALGTIDNGPKLVPAGRGCCGRFSFAQKM